MARAETVVLVKYAEMQFIQESEEDPGHEVLWFEAEDGRWFCMMLPPGKTFGADVEVQDA